MKKLKRIGLVMIVFVMLLALQAGFALAETSKNPLALDLVIMMDQSSGMHDNDKEGYRMDAAQIMISMCDMHQSRAAITWYDSQYAGRYKGEGGVSEVPRLFLNQLTQLDESVRRSYNDTLTYGDNMGDRVGGRCDDRGYRDFAETLEASINLLNNDSNNRKVLLIIANGEPNFTETDAYGRVSHYVDKYGNVQGFNKKITELGNKAKSSGIETIVIMMGTEGNNSRIVTALDNHRSEGAYTVSKERPIQDLMNGIFADLVGSDLQTFPADNKGFKIPNNSVKEVNIIIPVKGTKEAAGIHVCRVSDGGSASEQIVNGVYPVDGRHYKTVKMVNPQAGSYVLTGLDGKTEALKIQYVFNYSLIIESRLLDGKKAVGNEEGQQLSKNSSYSVETWFADSDQAGTPKSKDANLYDGSITAKLLIERYDDVRNIWEQVRVIDMVPDNKAMSFGSGDFSMHTFGEGRYRISVALKGVGLNREDVIGVYQMDNQAPEVVAGAAEMESIRGLEKFLFNSTNGNDQMDAVSIDLKKVFTDADKQDVLSYWLVADGEVVSQYSNAHFDAAINENGELTVSPKKQAIDRLQLDLVAWDDDAGCPKSASFQHQVTIIDDKDRYKDCDVEIRINQNGADPDSDTEFHKGDKITAGYEIIGKATDGMVPELAEPAFTVTDTFGNNVAIDGGNSASCSFTIGNHEGDYQISLTGRFGAGEFSKPVNAQPYPLHVVNRIPTKTFKFSDDGDSNAQNALNDQLDGGGVLLSVYRLLKKEDAVVYWVGSFPTCTASSRVRLVDVTPWYEDADTDDGDSLTYTYALYGPMDAGLSRDKVFQNDGTPIPDRYGETVYAAICEGVIEENEGKHPLFLSSYTNEEGEQQKCIENEGSYWLIIKAHDNDGAEADPYFLQIEARSLRTPAMKTLMYIVAAILAVFLIIKLIIRWMSPALPKSAYFSVSIGGAAQANTDCYFSYLHKPKAWHKMSELTAQISNPKVLRMISENDDAIGKALDAIFFKAAFGTALMKVKVDGKAWKMSTAGISGINVRGTSSLSDGNQITIDSLTFTLHNDN